MSSAHPRRDWVILASRWSRVFSAATVLIGAVELFAWVTRPAWIAPDSAVFYMKANAALGVTLLGVATWLSLDSRPGWRRRVALGLAAVSLAVGLATLLEYATTWSPGLDLWFGPDPRPDAGRMTGQTAMNLSVFAVSILTYARTRGPMSWLCDVCLFAGAVTLEVMAAGFFDHEHVLYDVTGRMMAARQSGVAQMLLGGALAFGRTGRGAFAIFAEAGVGSAAMRILIPAIAVLPIVLGRLRLFAEQSGWVGSGEAYVPTVLTVAQVVALALTVYVFARYMNRLDARYLVERKRREEIERYVAVCAWTRKVRWQGRWVSIEEFLQRRFGFEVTHGISDEALAEQLASLVPHGTLPDIDDEEPSR